MTKYFHLVEITEDAAKGFKRAKLPLVVLADGANVVSDINLGRPDFALHLQKGSSAIYNLSSLIQGIDLAL